MSRDDDHDRHLQHDDKQQQQHQDQQQQHQKSNVAASESRYWSLNCHFNHTLILMNCKSRAEAFARHLQTKLKSLGRLSADGADNDGNESDCENGVGRSRTLLDAGSIPSPTTPSSSPVAASTLSLSAAEQSTLRASSKNPQLSSGRLKGTCSGSNCQMPEAKPSKLNSSFGEDELYFDFDYSSPESPATEDNFRETDVAKQEGRDSHDCPNLNGHGHQAEEVGQELEQVQDPLLVTRQPLSSLPEAVTSAGAAIFEGESGCISAVSSVFTDLDDNYISELDDEDEQDFENVLRPSWPASNSPPPAELELELELGLLRLQQHRLAPITEQLTLEEVESPVNELLGLLTSPSSDPNPDPDDLEFSSNDLVPPIIMTSPASKADESGEQVPKDFNKLHVNIDLTSSAAKGQNDNDVTGVESESLLSPAISDDSFPQRVRRSSSLKSGKTPPGTPNRKKMVRFADALGLDLEAIKTVFLDDLPTVPRSAYDDLRDGGSENNPFAATLLAAAAAASTFGGAAAASWPVTVIVPLFQQPGSLADFLDRVRRQSVCLESAVAVSGLQLVLVVRVLNLHFHKSVVVRYSSNEWLTHDELAADYVPGSCDGFSDKFYVTLNAAHLQTNQRLVFAIRYSSGACSSLAELVSWDNNNGQNYAFQCVVEQGSCHPASSTPSDESWIHFL